MDLATLKAICAAYHKRTAADLTVNGVDLFLAAANSARKEAEKLHNFDACRLTATLDIDGETGGSLSGAVIVGGNLTAITATHTSSDTVTFYQIGQFANYPVYFADNPDFLFLYFSSTSSSYIISLTLTSTPITEYYKPATNTTNPIGVFLGHGFAVGTSYTTVNTSNAKFSAIKEIRNVQRVNNGGILEPLDFTTSDRSIQALRDEFEVDDYYSLDTRYPSDASLVSLAGSRSIVQRENSLFLYPLSTTSADPLSVSLEGYGWLTDYTATHLSNTNFSDWFLLHGEAYLRWAIVCQLNYYFKTFVFRNEGNLGSPEKDRDVALRDLILFDSYATESNFTTSR